MSKLSVSIIVIGVLLVAIGISSPSWLPDTASAADGAPVVDPTATPTPGEFPTNLTDDEIALIQGWNQWLFEREQAYKDAMYAQWQVQMGEDAEWLFGSFEESLGDRLTELTLEVNSLKATSNASLSAATQLQGLVATPTPVIVTTIEYVEVPVVEYVEVPVEVQIPPTQYDYCLWFETEMNRQQAALSGNIAPGTFFLIMHESGCNQVLGR